MAFTQTQLTALEEAIASGALIVKYADKQVTYNSMKDMLALRDVMRRDLGQIQSNSTRIRPTVSSGLERGGRHGFDRNDGECE